MLRQHLFLKDARDEGQQEAVPVASRRNEPHVQGHPPSGPVYPEWNSSGASEQQQQRGKDSKFLGNTARTPLYTGCSIYSGNGHQMEPMRSMPSRHKTS